MWNKGDRVTVSLPYGTDGKTTHAGTVSRVQEPGPHIASPHRTVKVVFDDPLLFGGVGVAWVSPAVIVPEGHAPAEPERQMVP